VSLSINISCSKGNLSRVNVVSFIMGRFCLFFHQMMKKKKKGEGKRRGVNKPDLAYYASAVIKGKYTKACGAMLRGCINHHVRMRILIKQRPQLTRSLISHLLCAAHPTISYSLFDMTYRTLSTVIILLSTIIESQYSYSYSQIELHSCAQSLMLQ